jgi:formylglycine-generating enzyme required for sulfatase activity
MKLRLIPAGEFMMGAIPGDTDAGDDEKPRHPVEISKPFYIGIYEVTQEQYEAVMGENPSDFKGSSLPVEFVFFNDAREFCRKLSQQEGVTYRLPTEAEWEYACRAGTTTKYYWGDSGSEYYRYGNFADRSYGEKYHWVDWIDKSQDDGHTETSPVGSFPPNAWGLYDMSGNVWEWCQDWYDNTYFIESPRKDPTGPPSGNDRVLRGGSWNYGPWSMRSSNRDNGSPDVGAHMVGFRVVREVE